MTKSEPQDVSELIELLPHVAAFLVERDSASAADVVLRAKEALQSQQAEIERQARVIAEMSDALDEADNIIAINCGTDTPKSWDRAIHRVQEARTLLEDSCKCCPGSDVCAVATQTKSEGKP